MNIRQRILLLTIVAPGLVGLTISLYYFLVDYQALIKAEDYVEYLAKEANGNQRKLDFAYHRALAHRINVFADGTWGLLGGVIISIGIHGLVLISQKNS
jgi:hypothetical protein